MDGGSRDFLKGIRFRTAGLRDLSEMKRLEDSCFSPNEAVSLEQLSGMLRSFPEMILVAEDREGKAAGFISGIAVREAHFRDDFFTDPSNYDPKGDYVMLLGLEVDPVCQRRGLGTELMRRYQARARLEERKALVLTCHEGLIPFYERLGFECGGRSASLWGGECWSEMLWRV